MKPLRYLFYRSYKSEREKGAPIAWVVPLIATAVASALNLMCAGVLILWIADDLPSMVTLDVGDVKRAFVIVVAIVVVVIYQRWIAPNRFLAFVDEFGLESQKQRQFRTVLLSIYAVVTGISPMIVGYVVGGDY